MQPSAMPSAAFPAALKCLFEQKRLKVLWGGRGAGRSWGVARALLTIGAAPPGTLHPYLGAPLRVLCAREYQNSMAESVHKVLSDQIQGTLPNGLGLEGLYEIQRDHIIGRSGTPAAGSSFSFEGIKNNTNRIKSYEGIDVCWVEEAVKVSRASWGVLIPTIRKEGSEIWMTFNPELETDYTYRRFVLEADPQEAVVRKMTWRDNPWFPEVLRRTMEADRERDPDYYLNVWEGHCRQILEGAVYARELRRMQEDERIARVPWDPEWPVDTAWDLGRADATSIWFFQRIALQTRVIGYLEASGEDIGHYIRELQKLRYTYGTHWLPHDARARRLGMKLTIEEILRQHYPKGVQIVPRLSVTDGINAARMLLAKCWMDSEGCADGLTALRHYKFKVAEEPDDSPLGRRLVLSNEPLHDWASHGADGFRMMAIAVGRSKGDDALMPWQTRGAPREERPSFADQIRGAFGWMR